MMMRWAIRTMFQNNPNAIVSVRELKKQLEDAIKPEATSGIGKTIIVTLRKWFGKPTRDNL